MSGGRAIAVRAAICDAGLEPRDVDGIFPINLVTRCRCNMSRRRWAVGVRWHNDISGGGTQCASILGDVQRTIHAGAAQTMVIFRFAERPQRQAARSTALRVGADAEEQFRLPFGTRGPVHMFAMVGQRFMHERNLTEDDLAGVVVQSRDAVPNERAIRRQAMTLDEYRAAADIDVALLYDAYSSLLWPGWRTALRRLAARFNNVLEAVRQLRGSATNNQVSDVQLALVTGLGGSYGSAAVPPWFGAVTARRSDTSTWVDELLAKRSAS